MAGARVFKSGNGQAVQLPPDCQFAADEVEIFRRGDEVVLREKQQNMARVIDLIQALPEEMFEHIRDARQKGIL